MTILKETIVMKLLCLVTAAKRELDFQITNTIKYCNLCNDDVKIKKKFKRGGREGLVHLIGSELWCLVAVR